MSNKFYFRIAKEAELACDQETGDAAEAYIKIDIKNTIPIETQEDTHKVETGCLDFVAVQLDICKEYIKPITAEEYATNTDELDDEEREPEALDESID